MNDVAEWVIDAASTSAAWVVASWGCERRVNVHLAFGLDVGTCLLTQREARHAVGTVMEAAAARGVVLVVLDPQRVLETVRA